MESTILQAVLPSFAIAFLGLIYSKIDRGLDVKSIANLIYYIFSPCLVFSSLVKRQFEFQEFFLLGGSVIVIIALMMVITFFYMRVTEIRENGFYLPIVFMNTGNIALPMAYFLYGNDGLSKAIIFHLVNVMVLYSLGVFLVSKETNFKQFLKIPFLYAAMAGVFIATVPIEVNPVVKGYLELVGNAIDVLGKGAIPLLIISLGYSLNRTKLADLRHGISGAGMRVFLGPAMAFGLILVYRRMGWLPMEKGYDLLRYLDLRTTEAIIVLMASMPAPITSFLLNEKFNNCPEKAASMVLVGTLSGVVTIPVILSLSHWFIFGPIGGG